MTNFFLNYYTGPVSNNATKEKTEKVVEEKKEKNPQNVQAQITFMKKYLKKHIYKKKMDNSTYFRKTKIETITNTRP